MFRTVLLAAACFAVAIGLFWFWPGAAIAGSCGPASFYGAAHHGKKMANGRKFDMYAMTAASWHYPLGTRVIVRNVQNGRSVQVTITDRGPARRLHRIIDLSRAAFAKLAPTGQGIIKKACVSALNK